VREARDGPFEELALAEDLDDLALDVFADVVLGWPLAARR
jgi:hypothetical protein